MRVKIKVRPTVKVRVKAGGGRRQHRHYCGIERVAPRRQLGAPRRRACEPRQH